MMLKLTKTSSAPSATITSVPTHLAVISPAMSEAGLTLKARIGLGSGVGFWYHIHSSSFPVPEKPAHLWYFAGEVVD